MLRPASLLFVLLAGTVQAQTFHVDHATGNDANNGTTAATAWKTIQKSFDSATPGSTVWIHGGNYAEHPVLHVSGGPGLPITFQAVAGEQVSITGNPSISSTILTLEDQRHIVLRGLHIQGLTVPDAIGLLIHATASGAVDDITIARCVVSGIGWTNDAMAMPGPNDNAQPVIALGAGSSAANAITNLRMDSLEVYGNITGFSEAVSIDGNVKGFAVNACDVHDNTNIGILAAGGYGVSADPLLDNARNGLITANRCWNNVSLYATSGGIYVDGADSILVERNQCRGNGYGIEIGCEEDGAAQWITVRNNALYHNLQAGLAIGGYDTGTTGQVLHAEVRNNTFFGNDLDNSGNGEIYITKASNLLVRNNIFVASAGNILFSREATTPQTALQFDYNCWYTSSGGAGEVEVNWGASTLVGFAEYASTTGFDGHGIFADPQFADTGSAPPDFMLLGNSPCIGSGDPLTTVAPGELDLAGMPRVMGTAIDMGAYESLATGTMDRSASVFSAYPNPVGDVVFTNGVLLASRIELRDASGGLVRLWPGATQCFNLTDLAPGVYVLSGITATGTRLSVRIMKR